MSINNQESNVITRRRFAPKTRKGCITCKNRRVKCDEARPECRRCGDFGTKCDGYALDYGMKPQAMRRENHAREDPQIGVSNVASCTALDTRALEFFRTTTAPWISGYFDDGVWDRIALQICHTEPAVRHAVCALASLHEERLLRGPGAGNTVDTCIVSTKYPLCQYTKAIAEVKELLEEDQVRMGVILACALLFIHFESIRQAFLPALRQADSVMNVLRTRDASQTDEVEEHFSAAIEQIDVQGSIYLLSRAPQLLSQPPHDCSTILPEKLRSPMQARDVVNACTSRLYHFMRTTADYYKYRDPGASPLEILAQAQELERDLHKLEGLLVEYMHRRTVRITTREYRALLTLMIRLKISQIESATCLYSEATIFDKYLTNFEEVVSLCTYALYSDGSSDRLLSVSVDDGLVQPLSFTALNCRQGWIRHQAVEQLRKLRSGGFMWHVESSIWIAELCIACEERHCGKPPGTNTVEDIPEWRRIHIADLKDLEVYLPLHKIKAHLMVRPNGVDGEWTELQRFIN